MGLFRALPSSSLSRRWWRSKNARRAQPCAIRASAGLRLALRRRRRRGSRRIAMLMGRGCRRACRDGLICGEFPLDRGQNGRQIWRRIPRGAACAGGSPAEGMGMRARIECYKPSTSLFRVLYHKLVRLIKS